MRLALSPIWILCQPLAYIRAKLAINRRSRGLIHRRRYESFQIVQDDEPYQKMRHGLSATVPVFFQDQILANGLGMVVWVVALRRDFCLFLANALELAIFPHDASARGVDQLLHLRSMGCGDENARACEIDTMVNFR